MEKINENIIIRLENISKIYDMGDDIKVKAVDGLSLEIKEGDFIAVMGPSGSGKSTAMNMIGSLDIPTYGKIYLDNENIANFSESELAQLRGKKIVTIGGATQDIYLRYQGADAH